MEHRLPGAKIAGTVASADSTGPKIVIFVIDGVRYSETFGDTTHTHGSRLWNDLRPQGTLLSRFRTASTVPGHSSIVTGTWQHLANDGSERPAKPTVFEYFRQAYSAPDSLVYVISGKTKLYVCSYGTCPGYGATYGARGAWATLTTTPCTTGY